MNLWNTISYLGLDNKTNLSHRRSIILTNRLIYFSFSAIFTFLPLLYFLGIEAPLIPSIIMLLCSALLFLLAYKKHHQIALFSLVLISIGYIVTINTLPELTSPVLLGDILHLFLLPAMLVGAVLLKRIKYSVLLASFIILIYLTIEYIKSKNHIEATPITTPFLVLYIFDVFVIFASIYYYIEQFKSIDNGYTVDIINQQVKIKEQHQKLSKAHSNVQNTIEYAKIIQSALFPSKSKLNLIFKDYFIYFNPKDRVAGDFYWIESNKHYNYFAIADCTGHGVPGALVSIVCINALNRALNEFNLTSTGEILDKTREIVIQEFGETQEGVTDGMDISLIRLPNDINLKESFYIEFSGANNPLLIVRNNQPIKYKGSKQPIGNYPMKTPFPTHKIELFKNDLVYLFTDGYADQFGGERGKKLKNKPFEELLLSKSTLKINQQRQELDRDFLCWKKDIKQVDDITIFGLKI